jgi:hypothetical protein
MPMPASAARAYGRGMTPSRPHLAAATFLTVSGLLVAIGAAAIAVASVAVATAPLVRSDDALLVDDLRAILPFVVAFAAIDLATARGLATGRAWAIAAGSVFSFGGVAMGVVGLLILGLANDPAMGIAAVAVFTAINLAGLVALQLSEQPLPRLGNATA